jgi:hypothetical protein
MPGPSSSLSEAEDAGSDAEAAQNRGLKRKLPLTTAYVVSQPP